MKPFTKEEVDAFVVELTAALRSGEYSQAKSVLRDSSNGFCCLGVACDLLAKKGFGYWRKDVFVSKEGDEDYALLPDSIGQLLGMQIAGTVDRDHPDMTLAHRNDDGATFKQIADFIEQRKHDIFNVYKS